MTESTYTIEQVGAEVVRCIATVLELESGTQFDDHERLSSRGLDVDKAARLMDELAMAFGTTMPRDQRDVVFPRDLEQNCHATYAGINDCWVRLLRKLERLEE